MFLPGKAARERERDEKQQACANRLCFTLSTGVMEFFKASLRFSVIIGHKGRRAES